MTAVLSFLALLLAGDQAPGALETRALDNLIAFTRLLGYVQYFHPSDEAAATDWNAFAVAGVKRVEGAADDAQLMGILDELFQPIAPTVRVFAEGAEPPRSAATEAPAGSDVQIVAWVHRGLGTGNERSIYRSDRVRVAKDSGQAPAGFPDVGQPWIATLIPGVVCQVPMALFARDGHTVPPGTAQAEPRRDPSLFSANERATRLAILALAWNVFQHFYPYFDVVATDWPAALRDGLRAAATDRDQVAFLATLRRLVAALHDGHGNVYLRGQPFLARPNLAWDWIESQLVITHVPDAAETSADAAPRAGDAVLEIDGRPVAQALAETEGLTSGATPGFVLWSALQQIGDGPTGTPLRLTVERSNGEHATVSCTRVPYGKEPHEDRPAVIEEIDPGIFYVDLDRVTTAQFEEALEDLAAAKGLVFDMRGYPRNLDAAAFFGHLTDRPLTSAQWHIPHVTRPDHVEMQFVRGGEWDLQPRAPLLTGKKAFLVDGRAISYAESCMGIVEHYKLGEIVGETTAGTNGNVNPVTLPGGYTMVWTGMKVLKHDGSQHHGIGIRPTVPVARTRRGAANGVDESLEKAIDIVGS
jgi:C-terminal processing protease CtpA/Prc